MNPDSVDTDATSVAPFEKQQKWIRTVVHAIGAAWWGARSLFVGTVWPSTFGASVATENDRDGIVGLVFAACALLIAQFVIVVSEAHLAQASRLIHETDIHQWVRMLRELGTTESLATVIPLLVLIAMAMATPWFVRRSDRPASIAEKSAVIVPYIFAVSGFWVYVVLLELTPGMSWLTRHHFVPRSLFPFVAIGVVLIVATWYVWHGRRMAIGYFATQRDFVYSNHGVVAMITATAASIPLGLALLLPPTGLDADTSSRVEFNAPHVAPFRIEGGEVHMAVTIANRNPDPVFVSNRADFQLWSDRHHKFDPKHPGEPNLHLAVALETNIPPVRGTISIPANSTVLFDCRMNLPAADATAPQRFKDAQTGFFGARFVLQGSCFDSAFQPVSLYADLSPTASYR